MFWANAADEADRLPVMFPPNGISPPDSILDILSLSERIDWDVVATRAREAPQELRHKDAVRNHTALFLAIQRDAPPFVIKTFLQLYPEAASHVQRLGLTPLHLSVARGSPAKAVKLILDAWPEAATKRMNDGCIPLHFVRDVDTAKVLLDANPSSLFIVNNASYLPLHRVATVSYASPDLVQLLVDTAGTSMHATQQLRAKTLHGMTPIRAVCEIVERDIIQENPVCPLKWQKLVVLAKAAHHYQQLQSQDQPPRSSTKSEGDFCLLHALLRETGVPVCILLNVISMHPEQLSKLDRNGRSALSIAASSCNTSHQVLGLLIQNPALRSQAGIVDIWGRYPLHYAALSGRGFDNGLGMIWKAAPFALTTPDPKTGLYPFQLAAMHSNDHDGESKLNTVFCLFRETPWLIPRMTKAEEASDSGQFRLFRMKTLSRREYGILSLLLYVFVLPVLAAVIANALYGAWCG